MIQQRMNSDLKRLKRADLLELLIASSKENERLEAELEQVTAQLHNKEILIAKSGSIAEAALQLNGVFEAAQNAARQYLDNIQRQAEQATRENEERCRFLERQTQERCNAMLHSAREETERYKNALAARLERLYATPQGLTDRLTIDVRSKHGDENDESSR